MLVPVSAIAQTSAVTGFCDQGATKAQMYGVASVNYQQGIVPSCTVTVYLTGTTTKATLFRDSNGDPLGNPFTATTKGQWLFYVASGNGYDVVLSGGIYPNVYTSPVTITGLNPSGSGVYCALTGCTITGNLGVLGSFEPSGMSTSSLATPSGLSGAPSSSGGSLSAGTYYAEVVAVDGSGNTTMASSEATATTTGSYGSILWTWSAVINAASYHLYVGTATGAETAYFSTTGTTYTQTKPAATPLTVQSTGYWHTSGNQILDDSNNVVRIAGINWYGFETVDQIVHGLYNQDYKAILQTIYNLGYNVIRLPFSNQMVESPIVPTAISYTDIDGNAINTDLSGLDALHVMDKIITYAGTLNLRVILDNHRSEAGDSAEASGLWYTSTYTQAKWLADWQALVTRYQGYTTTSGQPTVVGADIRNEPHNANSGGACWTGDTGVTNNCSTANTAQNWPVAATLAGNDILAINSHWLIFIEGTDFYDGVNDWWGGNLMGVASYPITLNTANRVVYSAHDYGPNLFAQTWFNTSTTYTSLSNIWNKFWGYISSQGIAPVWIGEFGTDNISTNIVNTTQGSQGQWFSDLVTYLSNNSSIGWTYYAVNGDDSYALLDYNYDSWPANTAKQELLNSIMPPYNTTTNGFLGQPANIQTTGSANIAGELFVNGNITTNGNVIGKLGKFVSGIISDGDSTFNDAVVTNSTATFNQGFTSQLSSVINGNLHVETVTGAGSATFTAGSTTVTGTSPSLAVYGSGSAVEFDFTVGTSPSASGVIATIKFPYAYPSTPKAVVVPNGTSLPTGLSWTTTTSSLVLSCSSTLTAGTYYKMMIIIGG